MKKTNKIKKAWNILVVLIVLLTYLFITSIFNPAKSYAASKVKEVELYAKGECGQLLTYRGKIVRTTYVVYQKDGVEYPAYCINKEKPGVGENGSYVVNMDQVMTDARIWRVAINGFPYQSAQSLGCENEQQAFLATKMAIYAMLYNYDMNDFGYMGDSGKRVYDALMYLRNLGINGTQTKASSNLTIKPKEKVWKVDTINPNYISKTYEVSSVAALKGYTILAEGGLPEGSKIVNEQNEEMNSFVAKEPFKLLIPIGELGKKGEFKLTAEGEVNTKAVFVGIAPNNTLQNYALTSDGYEIGKGALTENYEKNTTSITILKQDIETKDPLAGAEFTLYDAEKKEIKTNLITKEDGKIKIDELVPGTYYLKETNPPYGYSLYEDWIEIKLDLNEQFTVIVNDSKEGKTEVSVIKNTLEVKQTGKTSQKITKLPKTGM